MWVDGDPTKPDQVEFDIHVGGAPGANRQGVGGGVHCIPWETTSICQSEYRVLKHYQ